MQNSVEKPERVKKGNLVRGTDAKSKLYLYKGKFVDLYHFIKLLLFLTKPNYCMLNFYDTFEAMNTPGKKTNNLDKRADAEILSTCQVLPVKGFS